MYYRDTWVEIDLDRIAANVSAIKRHSGYNDLFAVVKANAYGHGDVQVAQTALDAGATCISVALLDEAIKLRRSIKDVTILVMGPVRVTDLPVAAEHNIDVTAFDLEWIEQAVSYTGKPVNCHLKIDSGMHRIGMSDPLQFAKACQMLDQAKGLNRVGVFTHFATADGDTTYYNQQVENATKILEGVDLSSFRYVHESNSAALLRHSQQPGTNAGRLGIAMYGLAPSDEFELPFALQQAMSLHSKITQIKRIKAGESVGYGATFTAEEDMLVGTMSIGYADGWLRYHQNRPVEINGKAFSIVGRVCMDQSMVRVDETVNVGDVVHLLNDRFTIDMAANDLKTINYEVVCCISDRVPRVYKKAGKVVDERNDRLK
jgi:alanine racemase